jgi:hypothetical protein
MSDTVEQQPAQEPVQLKIADLLLTAQLIQICSTRGAFKPEEFTQVGGLYERLVAFLQASGALTPPAEQPAGEQPAEQPAADSGMELPAA